MFELTREWLSKYYGSHGTDQKAQAINWLRTYGMAVPSDKLEEWADWKHLIEYQVNTNDIVDQCIGKIGSRFKSELEAHAWVNWLRVPAAFGAYQTVLDYLGPIRSIIELGVGGDSAISTSCFLNHLEVDREAKLNYFSDGGISPLSKWTYDDGPVMMSVDRNPLGMTAARYGNVPFWNFFQADSLDFLTKCIQERVRVDMVFIDTIHSYEHTLKELDLAYQLTDYMLMDDATFEGNDFDEKPGGVKRALEEWMRDAANWERTDYADGTVCLLQKL